MNKLTSSLSEAIRNSGLQSGMTVSFHHHFREGDLIVNMVMEEIHKMGLKNITLAYDLPQEWIHRAHLTKVQVYFSGENLLTFTPLAKMFDPESIFTSNSYTSEGGKNYPMNKVLSVGLVVNL